MMLNDAQSYVRVQNIYNPEMFNEQDSGDSELDPATVVPANKTFSFRNAIS